MRVLLTQKDFQLMHRVALELREVTREVTWHHAADCIVGEWSALMRDMEEATSVAVAHDEGVLEIEL